MACGENCTGDLFVVLRMRVVGEQARKFVMIGGGVSMHEAVELDLPPRFESFDQPLPDDVVAALGLDNPFTPVEIFPLGWDKRYGTGSRFIADIMMGVPQYPTMQRPVVSDTPLVLPPIPGELSDGVCSYPYATYVSNLAAG